MSACEQVCTILCLSVSVCRLSSLRVSYINAHMQKHTRMRTHARARSHSDLYSTACANPLTLFLSLQPPSLSLPCFLNLSLARSRVRTHARTCTHTHTQTHTHTNTLSLSRTHACTQKHRATAPSLNCVQTKRTQTVAPWYLHWRQRKGHTSTLQLLPHLTLMLFK